MTSSPADNATPYSRRIRLSTLTQRIPAATLYLAGLLRKPGALLEVGRSTGASILDHQLEHTSPIPTLPETLRHAVGGEQILLPPPRLFSPGNQDLTGLTQIVSIATALRATAAFEIGTFNGRTALTLAMNLPHATIYTLDLPPDEKPQLQVAAHDHFLLHQPVTRVYEGRQEAKSIVQLYGDSARFDFGPYERTCQLIYIDGAHSFEYVASDSKAAFRLADDCAAIIWDDYWRPAPGVVRYLNGRRDLRLFRLPESRLVVWLSEAALELLNRLAQPSPGVTLSGREVAA
jgi:hypothetical protein